MPHSQSLGAGLANRPNLPNLRFHFSQLPRILDMSAIAKITDRIISLIEAEGCLPWSKPWRVASPANAVSGKAYRGINRLLLSVSAFSDPRFLTFRQAAILGGSVKKGEHGLPVVFWQFSDEEDETDSLRSKALCRSNTIFNVQQCEGLNLPEFEAPIHSADAIQAAQHLVDGYANHPVIVHGGEVACYIPSCDRVMMPPRESFASGEAYFGVLAHELTHSTGHGSRLQRPGVTDPISFGSATYALEELVAELGAAFLCSEARIENRIEQSASYIAGWLDALKNDKGMIIRAAGAAQRASDWVLGREGA